MVDGTQFKSRRERRDRDSQRDRDTERERKKKKTETSAVRLTMKVFSGKKEGEEDARTMLMLMKTTLVPIGTGSVKDQPKMERRLAAYY